MALKSMTGFGEGTATVGGVRADVEIGSVNRKQLDINISLPRSLVALDALVQGLVRREFTRGRVSGVARVEPVGRAAGGARIDAALAAAHVKELRRVARQLGLPDNLAADTLVRLPGVAGAGLEQLDADRVAPALEKAAAKALRGLARMRLAEGRALGDDLRRRIGLLEAMAREIGRMAPSVVPGYRARLHRRLAEAGLGDCAADERVAKEIVLHADRCDVSEELVRLESHLGQARKLLRAAGPSGRTLDFLCQELFREINTVGAKAGDIGIARQVVAFKTELERIREQVQNVE